MSRGPVAVVWSEVEGGGRKRDKRPIRGWKERERARERARARARERKRKRELFTGVFI